MLGFAVSKWILYPRLYPRFAFDAPRFASYRPAYLAQHESVDLVIVADHISGLYPELSLQNLMFRRSLPDGLSVVLGRFMESAS